MELAHSLISDRNLCTRYNTECFNSLQLTIDGNEMVVTLKFVYEDDTEYPKELQPSNRTFAHN